MLYFFFFNDTATTEIYTLSLHDALPILTYSYMGMYCEGMARATTTSDAFNAVAEPRRRAILNYLAIEERPVGEIVDRSEEHTAELQSQSNIGCRLPLVKKKNSISICGLS